MIRHPTMHLNYLDYRMAKLVGAETVKGEPMLERGIGYVVAERAVQGRQDPAIGSEGGVRSWLIFGFAVSLAFAAGIFYAI